jgi:hypothetical protein
MTALRSLQQAFARGLDGECEAIERYVAANGLAAADRIGIYRNNVRARVRGALLLGFPAIAHLVGTECFRGLADEYQSAHPSRNGDLHPVGTAFPAHLRRRYAGTTFEYLADVAAVERAYQEVLVAADGAPFDLCALVPLDAAQYANLRFRLSPACRLVESRFPVARIWRANREEPIDDAPIDLGAGGDRLLLVRRALEVEVHALSTADFAFLAALAGGGTLGLALGAATEADPSADPVPLLRRFVAQGAIVGFDASPAPAPSPPESAGRAPFISARDDDGPAGASRARTTPPATQKFISR